MNFAKILSGLFIATFLLGTLSYILFYEISENVSLNNISRIENTSQINLDSQNKTETALESIKEDSEIIEENTDWKDRDETKFKIKLLETGDGFHGDDIDAKSGENWLGLFEDKGVFYLQYTKLKIRRVHDPIVDGFDEEEATQKTGKSVEVDKKAKPVFLLKNAAMLKEGEVKSLYHYDENAESSIGEDVSIRKGFVKEFKIGNVVYKVIAKKGKNKGGEDILALVIESEGISQTIHSIKFLEESDYLGSLEMAGDLDSDGKLDFYFDLYFHDNVEYRNLFLSSKAKKGKLVEKVAVFSTTGC